MKTFADQRGATCEDVTRPEKGKWADDAMRASEVKYRQLYESIIEAFCGMDMSGRMVDCNTSFCDMLGYGAEELRELTFRDITPEKWDAFEADIIKNQVLPRGYSDVYEKELRRNDGMVFPVESRLVLLRDNAGAPYGMWAVVRDITERVCAAKIVRRQLAFDQLITRLLARFASGSGPEIDRQICAALEEIGRFIGVEHAAVVQVSQDGTAWSNTHEWCAPGFPHLKDKHEKVAVGTFPWNESRLLAGEAIQVRSKTDLPLEAVTIRQLWEEAGFMSMLQVPLFGSGGTVRGCISLCAMRQELPWTWQDSHQLKIVSETIANVIERQRAREALRQSEMRYRTLFESAPDSIFVVKCERTLFESARDAILLDKCEQIADCNPATLRIFACSREQMIGQHSAPFSPACQPDGQDSAKKAREKIQAAYAGTPQFFEWRHRRLDGSEFDTEVMLNRFEVGQQPMLLSIVRDITARKQAEGALHQARDELARANAELERKVAQRTAQLAEANANLQTFTYAAAHDVRAPIRAIRTYANIAMEDYGAQLGPEVRPLLERVIGSADQMQRLLADLLDYCKMSQAELKLAPVDLRNAVSEAVALLAQEIREKNALVTVAEPLPQVLAHLATLVLLINNLISNALKFVAAGVQPHIRIWSDRREAESPSHTAPPIPCAHYVRLWVEDNGIGIASENQEKIFGAFERLHGAQAYTGTGLGLATVRKGAERMSGRVGVESEPGKGSRFWVELAGV